MWTTYLGEKNKHDGQTNCQHLKITSIKTFRCYFSLQAVKDTRHTYTLNISINYAPLEWCTSSLRTEMRAPNQNVFCEPWMVVITKYVLGWFVRILQLLRGGNGFIRTKHIYIYSGCLTLRRAWSIQIQCFFVKFNFKHFFFLAKFQMEYDVKADVTSKKNAHNTTKTKFILPNLTCINSKISNSTDFGG